MALFWEKLPFVVNYVSTKTEIIENLNAAKRDGDRYRAMFDGEMTKRYSKRATKMSYVIYFELPLTLKRICTTLQMIKAETLNHVIKEGLLDLAIRYFDETLKLVQTVYSNSMFYVRSTAEDIFVYFLEGLSGIPLENMLQISMNGPM